MPSNFYSVQKSKREYVIPFAGLKPGFYNFDYEISDSFFDGLEYSIIHSGDVHVTLELERKETMLIGNFTFAGKVKTDCDRCNDPVEVPVKGSERIIYKFGTEENMDETLIILHPDSYEIDVSEQIYELITVSLPFKTVHKEGECNEEVIKVLSQYEIVRDEDEDFDDDDYDDDDDLDSDDDFSDDDDNDDNDPDTGTTDPRWSILKDLN